MKVNKRRKLDAEGDGGGSLMSAFAARKRLLRPQQDASDVQKSTNDGSNISGLGDTESLQAQPARAKKHKVQLEEPTPSLGGAQGQAEAHQSPSDPPTPSNLVPIKMVSDGLDAEPSVISAVKYHSTFKLSKQTFKRSLDGRALVKLEEGERLVILGSYGLRIAAGEASVAGAVFRSDSPVQWVHAPRCHALPVIRAANATTIELQSHPAAAELQVLEKLSPVFGRLWSFQSLAGPEPGLEVADDDTFQVIFKSEDRSANNILQDLVSPAEWNRKIASLVAISLSPKSAFFICGPKSSGKSTFGRLLANRLVTKQGNSSTTDSLGIFLLDLDPGQPEYSVPGVVSLVYISKPNLASSFCHPWSEEGAMILRSHAIASVSPTLDPGHYVDCAVELFEHYQRTAKLNNPLIINTPGWIQGTGLDILTQLIQKIRPTEVLYLSRDGPVETVDGLQAACKDLPFCALPSQTGEFSSRTSLHLRTMQTMSYFHKNADAESFGSARWSPLPVAATAPWRVKYTGRTRGFIGVLCYDYQPAPKLLAEAISGTVVALVTIENSSAWRDLVNRDSRKSASSEAAVNGYNNPEDPSAQQKAQLTPLISQTPEGLPFIPNPEGRTLDPRHSRTIGLALVRGIDVQRRELQILTPISSEELAQLTKSSNNVVLVAGKFDIPSWAYTENLYQQAFDAVKDAVQEPLELADEDADEGFSQQDDEGSFDVAREHTDSPWIEILHGNQKRKVGSRVWRVRRDLGRTSGWP